VTQPARTQAADVFSPDLSFTNSAESRMFGFFKTVYHAILNFPDRVLHRRRHRSVLRRVSQVGRPRGILVVCHGNICRSPYLQAVLQRAAPDIAVSSAGFTGRDRPVPTFSLQVSAQRGLDLTRFRSRLISPESVRTADLIIVMEPEQARHIKSRFRISTARLVVAGDLDPKMSATRGIPDPWMQSVEAFESSFDRLDRCAEMLVRAIRQNT
jgi:protein-tyrosine phosphatase